MTHFQNPATTVDIIVLNDMLKKLLSEDIHKTGVIDRLLIFEPAILLVKRKYQPYQGMWAIPGGFLEYGQETLEQAAVRELKEETNLATNERYLKLLGVYSHPKRDPRGHVISHVFIAGKCEGIPKACDDAKELRFFSLYNLPELAFDHKQIIEDYIKQGYHIRDHM